MNDEIMPRLLESFDESLMKLSEDELRLIYGKVGERLRILNNIKQAQALAGFSVGERVCFMHQDQRLPGTVIRLNRKTVSVHTDSHQDWNVTPASLSKLIDG